MANWFSDFLFGSPEKHERVSTLRKEQEPLYQQLTKAGMGQGAGGAFGDAADYYRNLLSNNSVDYNAFAAPAQRQFHEETIPGLAEQFAGMGAGGLSSSGFQNAAVGAGTDLSERLGALRANLRQSGAQGLQNIGQMGLQNYSQDVMTQPGTQGALPSILGAVGTAVGGPALGAVGAMGGNWLTNSFGGNKVGKNTSPYGQAANAATAGANAGIYGR